MKKNNWVWVIGALLVGIFIGFMIGEEYERKRVRDFYLNEAKKENEESARKVDSLSKFFKKP